MYKQKRETKNKAGFAQCKDAEPTNARGRHFWLCQGDEPNSTWTYTVCSFLEWKHLSFTQREKSSLVAVQFSLNNIHPSLRKNDPMAVVSTTQCGTGSKWGVFFSIRDKESICEA